MNKRQIIKLLPIIGLILIMTSCGQKRDTKENFGRYSLDLLLSEKSAQEIYLMPNDSVIRRDKWKTDLRETTDFAEYLNKQERQIKDWRKKAKYLKLNNRQVEFLRTELDTVKFSSHLNRKDLTVYFLVDKEEHFFVLKDVDSLNNKWGTFGLSAPTNDEEQEKLLLKKRKEAALEPYTPYGIYFTGCNWEYKYAKPETFTNFYVTLKNSTSNDFKKLKFRVTITKGERFKKTEVFSKIIEKNETVYADDVVRFEINQLRDFYVGVNITDEDSFSWNARLIDAKPRPGYEDLPF